MGGTLALFFRGGMMKGRGGGGGEGGVLDLSECPVLSELCSVGGSSG